MSFCFSIFLGNFFVFFYFLLFYRLLYSMEKSVTLLKKDKQLSSNQQQCTCLQQEFPPEVLPTSQFYNSYLSTIQYHLSAKQSEQSNKLLKNSQLVIDDSNFFRQLQWQTISTDFESVTVLLRYGFYKLKINVIMTQLSSHFFQNQQQAEKGAFGTIYFLQYQRFNYAIKKIEINQKNFDQGLTEVYKQYMMYYIGSMLKVGPKICKLFGYDIIVTQKSVFFAMQKCDNYTGCKYQDLTEQAKHNLRVLHHFKFIHSDIKPSNIAYSISFRKCVFIDFGLSKLIQNPSGFKNLSSFCGSLNYCYEQMKINYRLSLARPVDLYYNDAFGLQKSLRRIKEQIEQIQKLDNHQNRNIYEEQPYTLFYREIVSTIKQSVNLFRLKYFIFSRNVPQIMVTLPKITFMPKSLYLILSSKQTEIFMTKDQKLKEYILHFRRSIKFQKNGKVSDTIISNSFSRIESNEGISQMFPLEQIFNLKSHQFQILMQNQQYINKILLYMDSLTQSQDNLNKKQEIMTKMIRKIQKVNKSTQQSLQPYENMNYFLGFINHKLKTKRNKNNIKILRLYYVVVQNWKIVQQLQRQIIQLTNDPIQRQLSIIQFFLFGLISLQKKYQIFTSQDQFKQADQEMVQFLSQVKKISQLIVQMRDQHQNVQESIQKCLLSPDQNTKKYRQSLQIIKILYLETLRINEKKQIKCNLKTLAIYSPYFHGLTLLCPIKQFIHQIFVSYNRYVPKLIFQINELQNKKQIDSALKIIKNFFYFVLEIFYQSPHLLPEAFLNKVFFIVPDYKDIIILLTHKILQTFRNIFNRNSQNKESLQKRQYQIYTAQRSILFLILYIKTNLNQSQNPLNSQQLRLLFEKIETLAKMSQTQIQINQQYYHHADNSILSLIQKIIKLHLRSFSYQQDPAFAIDINNLFGEVQILPSFKRPLLTVIFTELIMFVVQKLSPDDKYMLQNLLLKICQMQYEKGNYVLFEKREDLIKSFMKIYIQTKQISKCKVFIEDFINNLEQNKNFYKNQKLHEQSLLYALQAICLQMPKAENAKIYMQICMQKRQMSRQFYSFYVTCIFYSCFSSLTLDICERQIKRTCLSIKSQCPLHALISKQIIAKLVAHLKLITSKRKKIVFVRIQNRYNYHTNTSILKYAKFLQQKCKLKNTVKIWWYLNKRAKNLRELQGN